jgi:hypothetical protein
VGSLSVKAVIRQVSCRIAGATLPHGFLYRFCGAGVHARHDFDSVQKIGQDYPRRHPKAMSRICSKSGQTLVSAACPATLAADPEVQVA